MYGCNISGKCFYLECSKGMQTFLGGKRDRTTHQYWDWQRKASMLLKSTNRINIDMPTSSIHDAQEAVQVGATHDHLPVIFASEMFHQGWSRSNDVSIWQSKAIDPLVKAFVE